MSGHPQSTPRGLQASQRLDVGADGVFFTPYNTASFLLDSDSTGLLVAGGVKISNAQLLTGNSTGLVYGNAASSLPGNVDNGVLVGVISNSTGVALFINSTGTTHKYLNVTTVQPT